MSTKKMSVIPEIQTATLCRGLLLALATCRRSFPAAGPVFYDPFLATIVCARADTTVALVGWPWIEDDPLFGTAIPAANMLWEGLEDRVIVYHYPDCHTAYFMISPEQAQRKLEEFVPELLDWFLALGLYFDEHITLWQPQAGTVVEGGCC